MKKDIFSFLLVCSTFFVLGQSENPLTGKVTLGNGEPMAGVRVLVNGTQTANSNPGGRFRFEDLRSSEAPTSLVAYKEGFELSTWNFLKGEVTVYMRRATIRYIEGSVARTNRNSTIEYRGKSTITVEPNSRGEFNFKIPYDEDFNEDRFFIDDKIFEKVTVDEEPEKNLFRVQLGGNKGSDIYSVKVSFENGQPLNEEMVQINGQSFLTSPSGQFKLSALNSKSSKWSFGNYKLLEVDTNRLDNTIYVTLKDPNKPRPAQAARDTHAVIALEDTTVTVTGELSHGINHMNRFYTEQEEQLRRHNETVLEIHEKLSSVIKFNDEDHQLLTQQVQELTRSIESTSKAFNETREINMAFVLELRNKLEEKEQTIKEKNLLITQIQNHMLLVITILLSITLLLLLAVWTIKRFKAQNKVIERTKRELVKVQEMAKIGGMTYDSASGTFDYSENFYRALNVTDPERIRKLQGKTNGIIPGELIANDDRERVQEAWKEGMTMGEPMIDLEFKGHSETGVPLYIDMRTRFERNSLNDITYISSSLQDISKKKEQEISLRNALVEAEAASRAKEEFLAAMSHEIRTPLNAILGLTDHLIDDEPRETQKKNLEIIQVSGQHLLSLLNDVLDFSKIRAGKIKLEQARFDLKDLVIETVQTLVVNATSKGIKLEANFPNNIPNFILGDKLRIKQILINLISNGIKFTHEGSVQVSLDLARETDDFCDIFFSVKDTGVGIAPDKVGAIFNSFEQEDLSTSRKYGGTGLGLAICKQLVELLNGELQVESKLEEGSEFYFTASFPKASSEEEREDEEIGSPEQLAKFEGLKVLCVEDNEINQLVISQYLNNWKVKATYAERGDEALSKFGKEKFDLVFMDIRLPDMSGYEITEQIKKEYPQRKEPIIAFTAEVDQSTAHKIEKAGMVDFITKPFNANDLIKIMLKHIS